MLLTRAGISVSIDGIELFLRSLDSARQIVVASRDQQPGVTQSYWRTDSLPMALSVVEVGLGWGNARF